MEQVNGILIIHQGALGDFILSLPALRAFRHHYPDASIEIWGYPEILRLVERSVYADRIYSIERERIASLFTPDTPVPASLIERFRSFDLICIFGGERQRPFVHNLKRIGIKKVYRIDPFPPDGSPAHVIDHQASQLSHVGLNPPLSIPELFPSEAAHQPASSFPEERKIDATALLVALHPGSGSSAKVRFLLEDVRPCVYMPMDISKDYLILSARELSAEYPWLDVRAACADFTSAVQLPYSPAGAHRVAFFPGSSIGNFDPSDAVEFLRNIARLVGHQGGLLIGVDLKKSPAILNAAYNDDQGVTAAFNLNLLKRINRELDANFALENFEHHAFYNETAGRIEMHLISTLAQVVSIGTERFAFDEGEGIHTENSYKYTVQEFHDLAANAGLQARGVWLDDDELFSIHYLEVRD